MTTTPVSTAPLGLSGVLSSGLPVPIPSDPAATYTVPAVFSRRPEPAEITAITAADTAEAITDAGWPGVTLAVADRRLLIEGTSLRQLEDGLAEEIATRLDEISRVVTAERERLAGVARRDADVRAQRAHDDAEAAGRIVFVPRGQAS